MDEKKLDQAQDLQDEQLDDIVGGMRENASLEANTREAVDADDEGEDQQTIPFVKCPMCGRPFRFCTCYQ